MCKWAKTSEGTEMISKCTDWVILGGVGGVQPGLLTALKTVVIKSSYQYKVVSGYHPRQRQEVAAIVLKCCYTLQASSAWWLQVLWCLFDNRQNPSTCMQNNQPVRPGSVQVTVTCNSCYLLCALVHFGTVWKPGPVGLQTPVTIPFCSLRGRCTQDRPLAQETYTMCSWVCDPDVCYDMLSLCAYDLAS